MSGYGAVWATASPPPEQGANPKPDEGQVYSLAMGSGPQHP